jgi:hypothetical protein
MPHKSTFIPYTPSPFDAWHKFAKDDAMKAIVDQVLGDDRTGSSAVVKWFQYFENHLILPIQVMVECPIKKVNNNTISTTQNKMKVVSLAPIDRCPLPFLVFIAIVDDGDAGRYIFAQDVRKFLDNKDAEQVFIPYIYWLYFEKNKN